MPALQCIKAEMKMKIKNKMRRIGCGFNCSGEVPTHFEPEHLIIIGTLCCYLPSCPLFIGVCSG